MEEEGFEYFCQKLPKLELHAHLNGSLSDKTLKELHEMQNDLGCGDPRPTWSRWEAVIDHGDKRTLQECFQLFDVAHSLTTTTKAIQKATRDVIKDFDDDGVVYLELRSTPREVIGSMSKLQYIEAIVDAIRECSDLHGILVKLLISINRRQGRAAADEILRVTLEAHKLYPETIVGLDLSGNPQEGNIEDYLPLLEEARNEGLKIAVHVAEVSNTSEVQKILDFRPDRLGHATCVHPSHGGTEKIWQHLLDSQIPVEICLTSNVKTKTVDSYEKHHLKYLLSHKHPVCLGTDDKGVFATSLSQEYHHAALSQPLTREQIWDLSINCLKFVFASDKEKEGLADIFSKQKSKMFVN